MHPLNELYETAPMSRMSESGQLCAVTDRRYQRRRGDRPNALNLADTLALFVGLKEVSDPSVIRGDALIELGQFLMHIVHQIPDHIAKAIGGPFRDLSETMPQARDVPTHHDAMFGLKAADLVHMWTPPLARVDFVLLR